MDVITAQVAPVPFGNMTIEGLLLENGKFAVGYSQLSALNLIPPNRSKKQLESLLGFVFQSHQKAKTKLHPKAVNIIDLIELERVIVELSIKGNLQAIASMKKAAAQRISNPTSSYLPSGYSGLSFSTSIFVFLSGCILFLFLGWVANNPYNPKYNNCVSHGGGTACEKIKRNY